MTTIDLNADMGEGFGVYDTGADEFLLRYVTSANIACGYHAGDPHIMRKTVEGCLKQGVAIGAHPGLPDRLGFGRRELAVTAEEASDFVLYQVGALHSFVRAAGGRLNHIKLHGALYHMASRKAELAQAIVNVLHRFEPQLLLYGLSGSQLHLAAKDKGLRYMSEGFADRAYHSDGSLLPRHLPGAVLEETESIAQQAVSLALTGSIQTLCLHGDKPRAQEHIKRITESLQIAGVKLKALK